MEEKLAVWVYKKSLAKQEHSDYEKARIIYGWTILFYNLSKIFLILLVSVLLYSLKETLVCYIPFCLLRISGFGYHAKSSIICNLSSVFLFSVLPFILDNVIGQNQWGGKLLFSLILGGFGSIAIYFFAPSFTENSYTDNQEKVRFLKYTCLITFLILLCISYLLPIKFGSLMAYAMGMAIIFLIPNNIFRGGEAWRKQER
ncbi:accessory gene regulator B family protein [Enterococcus durans]|uniref:accessory gene regulator B family protein n=1 Tax=Enterococcus TaxID=1350 RepID=UPI00288F3CD6|nr:accessory gene regulator B family protein [Enterococcus durans]MDT2835595.1 accessory gene regulator B family protein [Enterococcus durans]